MGFFGKIAFMGGLIFQVNFHIFLISLRHWTFIYLCQQYNETTNAFGRIRDILMDNFSDTATKKVINLINAIKYVINWWFVWLF